MIHIKELKSGLPIFKALSSEVRIDIIELLGRQEGLNLNELATKLNLSNGAITMHIKKLEESGLIKISTHVGKHGVQKICYLNEEKFTVDLCTEAAENLYVVEIKVGHYSAYQALPTCGLATKDSIIGEFDDPRYFADPEHINAEILWLTEGFVEYRIPNYLKPHQYFTELQFVMELGSEAPGYCNNWPSDIYFYLNDMELGFWTSPGDFGEVRGAFNPSWWPPQLNQYGLLKLLRINDNGSFIDGFKISDIAINNINLTYKSDISLKIAVPHNAKNKNGLTLYGKSFGNYNQDLLARILYR